MILANWPHFYFVAIGLTVGLAISSAVSMALKIAIDLLR